MIKKFKKILDELQVFYLELSENEISIPCVANKIPIGELNAQNSLIEKIYAHPDVECFYDEFFIHVKQTKYGLDWAIAIDNNLDIIYNDKECND